MLYPTSLDLYFLLVTFIFSLLVGSFLNVVIYRLPKMMDRRWQKDCTEYLTDNGFSVTPPSSYIPLPEPFNLALPHSSCPHCNHPIRWFENIPLISYFILLKGKCSACKAPISLRYPTIELSTALLSTFCIYALGFNALGISAVVLTWLLVALSWIDIDHKIIPDEFNFTILWLGLLLNTLPSLGLVTSPIFFASLPDAILGAIIGYGSLWSVYKLFKLLTGKEGMGYGDFKLLAALGAWVGASSLLVIVLLSSVAGAIIGGLVIVINRKGRDFQIPFGPYLAIAGWITLLFGSNIINWYLSQLVIK